MDIKPSHTFVYKTVGKLDISLDLYLPSNASKVPTIAWFHGGGLLQGHRSSLAAHMRRAPDQHNVAVISADYRLAPQTAVPEILQDVKDCISFIRNDLVSQMDDKNAIDPSRLAVSGSSAGGYLALLAGLYVEPKPQVLAPIYPITDPLGTFFTTSQPPPRMRPYSPSEEEVAPFLDPKGEEVANCGPASETNRVHMYAYMMRAANLAKLLGVPEPEIAAPFRISRNVYERRLPPAYILHGDADSAVGVEQADEVVGAMLGCGVEVKYERVHGGDHFLDAPDEYVNDAMYGFIMKHLR